MIISSSDHLTDREPVWDSVWMRQSLAKLRALLCTGGDNYNNSWSVVSSLAQDSCYSYHWTIGMFIRYGYHHGIITEGKAPVKPQPRLTCALERSSLVWLNTLHWFIQTALKKSHCFIIIPVETLSSSNNMREFTLWRSSRTYIWFKHLCLI